MTSSALLKAIRVVWMPVAVIATHWLAAAIFGHQRQLDPFFHLAGGVAGADALWCLLSFAPAEQARRIPHRTAFVVGSVLVVALLWEGGELLSDRWRGTHIQAGPFDTWSDVALGVAGAVIRSIGRGRV